MLPLQTKTTCTVTLGCRAWIRCATTATSTPRRGCSTSPSTSAGAAPPRLAARPARRRARRPRPATRPPRTTPRPARPSPPGTAAGPTRCSSSRAAPRGSRCSRRCGRGWRRSCTPGSPSRRRRCGPPGVPVARVLTDAADGHRLRPDAVPADADLVVVGNPTNPTGVLHPAAALRALRRARAGRARRRGVRRRRARRAESVAARMPGLPRVPQPHQDLGARRAARGLRARRARRAGPARGARGRRGRCRRLALEAVDRLLRARGRGRGRAARPREPRRRRAAQAGGARGGPRGDGAAGRRAVPAAAPARRPGRAGARRAARRGHRRAPRRHVPRPRPRPPAGRRPVRGRASRRARRGAGRGAGRPGGGDDARSGDAIAALEARLPARARRRAGTRSGWSAATRPSRCRVGARRASTRSPRPSTRRSPAARSCWSPTTRCCCAACTASAPTPRRARSCTAWSARARRCSPRTPTPTPPTPASPTRSPTPSGWPSTGPLVAAADPPLDKFVTFVPDRPDHRRRARRAVRRGRGQHRRLLALLVRHRGHRPVPAARRGAPDDRRGRAAGAGGRDAARDGAAPGAARRGRAPRCGPRTRTRSPRSTCSSSPPLPSARGLGRIGTLPAPEPLRGVRRPGRAPACPPRRGACGRRATRTGRSAGRGLRRRGRLGARRGRSRRASTPTSPPTCATTPPSEHLLRSGAPALVDVAHWARSGRGARRRRTSCATALGGSVEVRVSHAAHRPWTVGDDHREDTRMKADPAVQRRLLDLADVDAELTRLAHRRRTLPEHAQLTDAETAVRAAKDKLVGGGDRGGRPGPRHPPPRDATSRACAPARSATRHDARGLRGRRQAGDELQHELETLARRQTVLEDEQLEVMEQREAVGVDVEHARGVLAEAEQARRRASSERRDTALADIDAAEAGRTPRPRARSPVTCPPICSRSTKAPRAAGDGRRAAAAAALRGVPAGAGPDARWPSCRAAPADEVVHCEECGVILVRTPESGL